MRIPREPALWVGIIATILTAAAALGVPFLSAGQAAAITTAVAAIVTAVFTRPIAPAVFVGAFGAFAAMFSEYGLHWSDAQVAAISSLILGTFTFFGVRPQVDPTNYQGKVVEGEVVPRATVPR